ncbi:hypothetical protein [Hydrogenophaga intermedia]|uniref:Uncharacterized protein n=1 Tax=Hydrogenophaga intermedia TaxID=65786 RepID=A0A1L1PC24_HYDIT|nr:hypothetical protein [Hydrogenophaga intermedia]TMU72427.1 hypothetical protein FGJ01_18810 [Hydrogenophaga intermedia]CDN87498.1 hypothetical protein BN948_01920 [Hydrogenophaga intermedia]
MKDDFKVHDVARVKAGDLAGMVGVVQERHPGVAGGWATVRVQGVKDDAPVDETRKFKVSELERNHVR